MANTTNFGWETPDDTDLVKDGASAIRTLGSAIDTSLVDLKGGTTGQVLSKASNSDMDFTWVAQDDSNAIQNALLTTTGDTIYASSASTPARLGIGSTGQVLTVSGGVPTWATPTSGGMTLLSTTTLSGTATTVSSISGSYTNLFILIEGASSSGAYRPKFYSAGTAGGNFAAIIYPSNFVSSESDFIGSTTGTGTGTGNALAIQINNYTSSTYKSAIMYGASSAGGATGFVASGIIGTLSAITSITYTTAAGTATFSGGTIKIWGVK